MFLYRPLRELEQYAKAASDKLNFNTEEEAEAVEEIFASAIQCLSEEDRALQPVGYFLPMLKKGIAVHHSGLLPILKEVVEILFQEGMIKVGTCRKSAEPFDPLHCAPNNLCYLGVQPFK